MTCATSKAASSKSDPAPARGRPHPNHRDQPPPPVHHSRHGVWFPSRKPGQPRDGQRWAFMFRWSTGRQRAFDRAYPHRLQMSEAEKAGVAARVAKAAARTKRRENPPASAHAMSKRARA
jgi:hypothetical protein